MTRFYLYDDAKARGFEPFALTRPVSELRAGAELIRRRWERAAGANAYGFIGAPHLANFDELDAPHAVSGDTTVAAGSLIANSRFVVSLAASLDSSASVFSCDGSMCAVRLTKSMDIGRLSDGTVSLEELVPSGATAVPIAGRWLTEVWDLVGVSRPSGILATVTVGRRAAKPLAKAKARDQHPAAYPIYSFVSDRPPAAHAG